MAARDANGFRRDLEVRGDKQNNAAICRVVLCLLTHRYFKRRRRQWLELFSLPARAHSNFDVHTGYNNPMSLSLETSAMSFWSMPPEEVADALETDIDRGIDEAESLRRYALFGGNTIERPHRTSGFVIFLRQFNSPLILILLGATLLTLAISHYRDALFIFIAVLANVTLGFYQEHKAERVLSELKSYLKQRARVVRGDVEHEIDAERIVPGDIIRLSQGDRVPADARVVFANDLRVDEAILTGESLPVEKTVVAVREEDVLADQGCVVFAGTLVTQGVGTMIVCRTGGTTEFGKIASLVAKAEHEATPLQVAIQKFSIRASIVLSAFTAMIFFIGIGAGHSYLDMFLTSVAIAVAAIPEGLPVALTVILAVGVERMAKRNGVVRKLVAAEALGDVTVILTDKTGTLTMAKMELADVLPLRSMDEHTLISRALLNTSVLVENKADLPSAWRMSGPIMEVALVRSAALRGIDVETVKKNAAIDQSLPFNAVNKFSVSLMRDKDRPTLIFFGAPDILVERSTLGGAERERILATIDSLARAGKRVLGVATKETRRGKDHPLTPDLDATSLQLEGLITFHDPVRPSALGAIRRVERAGIRTIIVTGDHLGTAESVARDVGLLFKDSATIEATDLAKLSDKELAQRLASLRVIARVTPLDKVRIVRALQRMGEIVAMTGDGVNDAPSIKQADIGITMGSGTEVARSVADLVLLDDNFETIAAAVDEGRQIMSNIRKVIVYLLSTVMDELVLIGGALIAGVALPLNALQILWVNFFSDSFPAVAFAFEKGIDGLSSRAYIRPGGLSTPSLGARSARARTELFDPLMRFLILVVGVSSSALLLALYLALLYYGYEESLVRTFIFACFGSYTLFVAFSVRSLEKSIFSFSPFSNMYLVAGVGVGIALMFLAIYAPILQSIFDTVALPPLWLAAVVFIGILNILAIEAGKWIFRGRLL